MKKILIVFIMCFFIAGLVYAEHTVKIADEQAQEGEVMTIFKDDLEDSEIIFLLLPDGDFKEVEVSLDKGRSWDKCQKTPDGFIYEYRPRRDEELWISFLLVDDSGKMKTYDPHLKVQYIKEKPESAVLTILNKMKTFYEQENKHQFMAVISPRFPDRVKFEEAIQNDFFNYRNIRLRYRIDRKVFSESLDSAIWNVYWERKASTRDNKPINDSSNIRMQFVKEGARWLLRAMQGNNIFGSTLAGDKPDFSISSSDITCSPTNVVGVTVHNPGNADASNVQVRFQETVSGTGCIVTVPRVTAHSYANVSGGCVAGCNPGTSFIITVDPSGLIDELDATNNTATANF